MKKIIQLIRFFFVTIVVFFILPFTAGFVAFYKIWNQLCSSFLGVKFEKVQGSQQVQKNKRTILLLNHRTQGDFFLHDLISEGTGNFLSRMMVAIIFPALWIASNFLTRSVWFFKRGGNDLQQFFKWIDMKFDLAYRKNLVVYPEGHRMGVSKKAAQLKKGMIQYAYDRKMDVQIIISFGSEKIFNEKQLHASFGPNTVLTFIDETIDPKNFKTFQDFYDHISMKFSQGFDKTYALYESIGKNKIK